MENLENIRFMLANKSPDLSDLKNEIAEIVNTTTFQLRDVQLLALAIICEYGMLFGNIGVGHGKTFISLLARVVSRSKRCLLFVPSDLISQLTQEDIPALERELGVSLDWCTLDGVAIKDRVGMMDKHSLTIIPYSLLSTTDTYDILEASYADMIVFDEAHYLKNVKTPRTRRLIAYWQKNLHINLVFLSGTMSNKSILDYHHMITRGLHKFCPLPYSYHEVVQIQEATAFDNDAKYSVCYPLCKINPKLDQGKGMVNVEEAKKFMKTLLKSSPCVILTGDQSVECSMQVDMVDNVKLPKKLLEQIEDVDKSWLSPNGDLIEDDIVKYAVCSQLADGFWYRLFWADGTPQEAIDLFQMKREVEGVIRSFILKRHRDKLDTPLLVYQALANRDNRVSDFQKLYDDYITFKSKHPTEYKRDRETIWLDKTKEIVAVNWAKEEKSGIIFYSWDATGESLYKRLKKELQGTKIEVIFCNSKCELSELKKANCIQVTSYAHHKGKNLHQQNKILFYDIPTNGKMLEQAMGRIHRMGQKEDCCYFWFVIATKQDKAKFENTMLHAKWRDTTMQPQKILIANFVKPSYKRLNTTKSFKVISENDEEMFD